MNLAEIAKQDIAKFLNSNPELFFNENDFQMNLALYLRQTGHYDDVEIEYYIPYTQLEDYLWRNELYIDIVVEKDGEYLPIELKYPTKRIARQIHRFGEMFPENVVIVKEQGAQDIVLYNYWKDVRRLELVSRRFASVRNGLAVILTNDPLYLRTRRKGSMCEQFSCEAGKHGRHRCWTEHKKWTEKYPDFHLYKEYDVHWNGCKLDGHDFNYCIITT